jgi:hypothetical protein
MTDLPLTILAELRAGALRTSAGRMPANFSFGVQESSYEVKP